MKTISQKDRILEYLKSGRSLMRLESWDKLGVVEAPARVSELRSEGYPIRTQMISVINRYGETVRVARWSLEQSHRGITP